MSIKNTAKQDDLVTEFQSLVRDTEKLLESTANLAGDQAAELRLQVNENLVRARETLSGVQESLREKSKVAVQTAEEYVLDKPWQAVGVAVGIGFVLGLITARR
ncbi:DUF883 family protein [Pseudomonas sp. RIT-PI-AD]|uniref:DUF883 family protein n=1 Tax=Pseudomonas sp. RIT-PI-AD TaxID=3035294 RepID=UPI0021D8F619|nr:DUF883 family protein [Pseudomonas sp. RIT-PI-AD]